MSEEPQEQQGEQEPQEPQEKTRDEYLQEILAEIPIQVQDLWGLRNDIEHLRAGGKVEGYDVPVEQIQSKIDERIASIATRKRKIDTLTAAAKTAPLEKTAKQED